MTSIPFFSLNVSAWMVATAGLKPQEIAALISMLMVMAASTDHRLPDDDVRLARTARCTLKAWREIRPAMEGLFIVGDGVWRHEWIEKEAAFIAAKQAKKQHAARMRWQPKSPENNETRDASASDLHAQNDATFTFTSPSQEKKELSPSERGLAKPKRRSKLPPDFTMPEPWILWAENERPDLDVRQIAQNFMNHAHANGRVMADWKAAWRLWIGKEPRNGKGTGTGKSERSRYDPAVAVGAFTRAARRP